MVLKRLRQSLESKIKIWPFGTFESSWRLLLCMFNLVHQVNVWPDSGWTQEKNAFFSFVESIQVMHLITSHSNYFLFFFTPTTSTSAVRVTLHHWTATMKPYQINLKCQNWIQIIELQLKSEHWADFHATLTQIRIHLHHFIIFFSEHKGQKTQFAMTMSQCRRRDWCPPHCVKIMTCHRNNKEAN